MKYLLKLAIKNIIRSKRRTILTFTMLSFCIMVYIFMSGLYGGIDEQSFQNLIDFETGHFKIRSKAFNEDYPHDLDALISDYQHQLLQLRKLNFISGYAERINFLVEIDNTRDSSPAVAIGIDPVQDRHVFNLEKYIMSGKLLPGGALLGVGLAKDMGLLENDPFYITFRSQDGMFTSIELNLSGLVQCSDPKINNNTIFLHISEARQYLNIDGATEIAIKTDDFHKTKDYQDDLDQIFGDKQVLSWRMLAQDFTALMESKKAGSYVLIFLILIIAIVGIINTMLMSVYEKRQQIATLKALGMQDIQVRCLFIIEGLLIGVMGTGAGLLLGSIINSYFANVGIDLEAMYGGSQADQKTFGLNVWGKIYPLWVWTDYVRISLLALAATALASFYPAQKVMKMQVVDGLRSEQ